MSKHFLTLALGLTLAGILPAASFRTQQNEQRQRINQGLRSGELTRQEALRLYGRQAILDREAIKDLHDGRGLTPMERRKLNGMQNRLSRSIYRQKHDRQVR
jgi:hypothetical protein